MDVVIDDLRVQYGSFTALGGVTCSFTAGVTNGLIGPNGAGKTTLLNVLSGLAPVSGGAVRLGGENVAGCVPQWLWGHGLSRTFQTPRLHAAMSVEDNVVLGLRGRPKLTRPSLPWRPSAALRAARERARAYLDRAGAGALVKRRAGDLSLHEQRVVELVRALASEPRVLMLDEPTSGLGKDESEAIIQLAERGTSADATIILVSHDTELIFRYVTANLVVLDQGRCIASGPAPEVVQDPKVKSAYLGENLAPRGKRP